MEKRVPAEPPCKAEADVRKMSMYVFSEAGRAGKDSDHQVCLQPQHEGMHPAAYPHFHRSFMGIIFRCVNKLAQSSSILPCFRTRDWTGIRVSEGLLICLCQSVIQGFKTLFCHGVKKNVCVSCTK